MEVPDSTFVVCPIQVLSMLVPGARISTSEPKLLNDANSSASVVAPTAQTDGSEAGEDVDASAPSFPAATARKYPADTIAAAAALTASEVVPPKDMLTTIPLGQPCCPGASSVTKSMPLMTAEFVPTPVASSTLTAKSVVFFATP
jgi:hypothetical protein